MSVLIKGMEMPKSCDDCPFGDAVRCNLMPGVPAWWAEYDKCVKEKRLHIHCPLVPVPKHGRLIDADKLCLSSGFSTATEYGIGRSDQIEAIKRNAPTIIPAEEGE